MVWGTIFKKKNYFQNTIIVTWQEVTLYSIRNSCNVKLPCLSLFYVCSTPSTFLTYPCFSIWAEWTKGLPRSFYPFKNICKYLSKDPMHHSKVCIKGTRCSLSKSAPVSVPVEPHPPKLQRFATEVCTSCWVHGVEDDKAPVRICTSPATTSPALANSSWAQPGALVSSGCQHNLGEPALSASIMYITHNSFKSGVWLWDLWVHHKKWFLSVNSYPLWKV